MSGQAPAEVKVRNEAHHCPVVVKFRWSNERMVYARQQNGWFTQHNHPLELKDKHYLNDPLIRKELELFAKVGLSVANIYKIIKKKFAVKVRYQDVYNRMTVLKKEMGLKERAILGEGVKTQYEEFIDSLNKEQEKYKETWGRKEGCGSSREKMNWSL